MLQHEGGGRHTVFTGNCFMQFWSHIFDKLGRFLRTALLVFSDRIRFGIFTVEMAKFNVPLWQYVK